MIKSMTGFGNISTEINNKKYEIEIRTLNSKQLDISCKIPNNLKSYEILFRNELTNLTRGKIDLYISCNPTNPTGETTLNTDLIQHYYRQLQTIANTLQQKTENLFEAILQLPNIFQQEVEDITPEELETLVYSIKQTIEKVQHFKINEGNILAKDFTNRIKLIQSKIQEISPFEKSRIIDIRSKMMFHLNEISPSNVDSNRLEQELIYYIEKLDITEEKVRLQKHLDHFVYILNNEKSQGKKLGFIAQEIGREINTLGSKANNYEIQRIVVEMKDELEKIKEQLFNIE